MASRRRPTARHGKRRSRPTSDAAGVLYDEIAEDFRREAQDAGRIALVADLVHLERFFVGQRAEDIGSSSSVDYALHRRREEHAPVDRINREIKTLDRVLRLALECRKIRQVPILLFHCEDVPPAHAPSIPRWIGLQSERFSGRLLPGARQAMAGRLLLPPEQRVPEPDIQKPPTPKAKLADDVLRGLIQEHPNASDNRLVQLLARQRPPVHVVRTTVNRRRRSLKQK
jgi:hypothetical protein